MNLKDWFRFFGVVLFLSGLLCFPLGIGINPKRDTSAFFNLADFSVFLKIGSVLITCGLLVLFVSVLISSREHEDYERVTHYSTGATDDSSTRASVLYRFA